MEANLHLLFKDRTGNVFGPYINNPAILIDFTTELDTATLPKLHVTICSRLSNILVVAFFWKCDVV
jgi:hypothetical protein